MFEGIFKSERALARHRDAPLAEERFRYIQHCIERGSTPLTIELKCRELLWAARLIRDAHGLAFDKKSLHALATQRAAGQQGDPSLIQERFENIVRPWLRYLGWWEIPPAPDPWHEQREAYCIWMASDRGFCDSTIAYWDRCARRFLIWCGATGRCLRDLEVSDFDAYIAHLAADGCSRRSISNLVKALRSFVRFAGDRGWCRKHLAEGIEGPRVYSDESLPMGPPWPDVERLLKSVDTNRPRDVRGRAILMLLAIYGLRAGEVRKLRLDDVDWEHDFLHVRRVKRRKVQTYPLAASVGAAIARYLREVRPPSKRRELFLGLNSPHGPVSQGAIHHIVATGLKRVGARTPRFGPHSLRHACAGRLVSEGFSLKEIGDHLGHRGVATTRIYAKVNLPALREVAAFDLGGLR
jgi:site-specific recombinase XerD